MHWYTDVLKKYTLFEGRATRQEYWMFVLLNFIVSAAVGMIAGALGMKILSSLYALVVLLPSLAVAVRRLHDTDRSGWWLLLILIPLIGWIILIIFLATDTQAGTNQHGINPKGINSTPTSVSTPTPQQTPAAVPTEQEVVINDIPVADPAISPEEKN